MSPNSGPVYLKIPEINVQTGLHLMLVPGTRVNLTAMASWELLLKLWLLKLWLWATGQTDFIVRQRWIFIQVLPRCVILAKLFNLCEPECTHLQAGNDKY